jgi:hypothetical protein
MGFAIDAVLACTQKLSSWSGFATVQHVDTWKNNSFVNCVQKNGMGGTRGRRKKGAQNARKDFAGLRWTLILSPVNLNRLLASNSGCDIRGKSAVVRMTPNQ